MGIADRSTEWLCPSCSDVLGDVVNGEFHAEGVSFRTRGINVVVLCECGREKIWYPSISLDLIAKEFVREVARLS